MTQAGLIAVAIFCLAYTGVSAQPAMQLIERTLAIVGSEAITLSDVQTATALGLVEGDQDRAVERLVERALILREVERYSPPEPDGAVLAQRLSQMRDKHSPDEFSRILAAGGFTEARLLSWIRDDLRISAYLNQRFSATGASANEQTADWIADLRRRTTVVELWKRP